VIRLEVKDSVRCGEDLVGQAVWNSDGAKEPRRVLVECRWRLEGKGAKYEYSIDEMVNLEVAGKSQVTVPFQFTIDGPPSYEGKLFRIVWEVVARADLPWAIDEVETKIFLVQPALWTADDFENYENAMNDLDSDEEDEEDDDSIPAGT
jgi:hypothetical protein